MGLKLNQFGVAPIVLVIAGVLVLGAIVAGVYVVTSGDDTEEVAQQEQTQEQNNDGDQQDQGDNNALFFQPEPPYAISVVVTDPEDPSVEGEVEVLFESADVYQFTSNVSDGTAKIVYDKGDIYSFQEGQGWFKFPAQQIESNTEQIEGYVLTQEEIDDFSTDITQLSSEACATGTCDVYLVPDGVADSPGETKVYVDQGSRRVVKVTNVSGTTTTVISYDFTTDATVEVPTDYQDFTDLEGVPELNQ